MGVSLQPPGSGPYAPQNPRGATCVFLGDSITVKNSTPDINKYGESFATYLPMMMGQQLQFLANAGVASDTVEQMAARLATDVLAKNPALCFILAGTNNVVSTQTTYTQAQSMADYENLLILPMRAQGIQPIIATIPPRTGTRTGDPTTYAQTLAWNAFLRRLAAKRGLPLVDFHKVLTNPATGDYITGYSGDGVHPDANSALVMATEASRVLAPWLPPYAPFLSQDELSSINLITNGTSGGGLFLSGVNGNGVPSGWSSSMVSGDVRGTTQIVSPTGSLIGNWFQLNKATGSTAQANFNRIISTGFSVGDRLAWLGKFEIGNLESAGGAQLTIDITFRDSGTATISSLIPVNQFTQAMNDMTFYIEGVVPAGTASIRAEFSTSVAGGAQFRVGQMTLINLTALGLAGII